MPQRWRPPRSREGIRRWLSDTSNLTHFSVLIFAPIMVIVLLELGVLSHISYFLFPPLASATFTLFFEPEDIYSQLPRVTVGLWIGAVMGWAAFTVFGFGGVAAGTAMFATGVMTWITQTEHPSAFSTSMLAVVLRTDSLMYVMAVVVSTLLVAGIFAVWRRYFFERRSELLYESTDGDDSILVPVVGEGVDDRLPGLIAGAHEAGQVVFAGMAEQGDEQDVADRLEEMADRQRSEHGVNAEAVVMTREGADAASWALLDLVDRYDCDALFLPWADRDRFDLGPLFDHRVDVFLLSGTCPDGIEEILVPTPEDRTVSHTLVDIGLRLTDGTVTVCELIGGESERRSAEQRVLDIIDGFDGSFETRVTNTEESYPRLIAREAVEHDLVIMGHSVSRDAGALDRIGAVADAVDVPLLVVETE